MKDETRERERGREETMTIPTRCDATRRDETRRDGVKRTGTGSGVCAHATEGWGGGWRHGSLFAMLQLLFSTITSGYHTSSDAKSFPQRCPRQYPPLLARRN